MSDTFASEFAEIPAVLLENDRVRTRALDLATTDAIPGKVTEGGGRLEVFRMILASLIGGEATLAESIERVQHQLPRGESLHAGNNRVFPQGWAERLVRTQFSRFYNQAVLELLREDGNEQCFVPHSHAEAADSPCSIELAGHEHEIEMLYTRLTAAYRDGQWSQEVKIPNHPHCTHVVMPLQ